MRLHEERRLSTTTSHSTSCRQEAAILCPRPKVDRQRLALGGDVVLWCRQYKLCSDLNNQPKLLMTLTFDLLTVKVVSESRVTWATSVPILVFLGLSVLDLSTMYSTDRQTDSFIA